MASNPHRFDPDITSGYESHPRFDLPMVPKAERRDWLPFRPICDQVGYDLPAALNEGWTVRVFDWRFERMMATVGQASPERLMIHKTWYDDFLAGAGVKPDAPRLLDIGIRYQEALDEANDAFDDAVDAAQQVRIVAQDQAETEFLNALSEYETKRSG